MRAIKEDVYKRQTLDYLETLKGDFFIPTHAEASSNLKNLIELNRNKVFEIINLLLDILKRPLSLNVITKKVFDYYQIEINYVQYLSLIHIYIKCTWLHCNIALTAPLLSTATAYI